MGISFIILGQINIVKEENTFIVISIIIRFIQGFSFSWIQTTMYSISTNFLPEHKAAMSGYLTAAVAAGFIFGPLIASGLYKIGGYQLIYNGFGLSYIIVGLLVKIIFGPEVDKLIDSS
jgi:MFS family permease